MTKTGHDCITGKVRTCNPRQISTQGDEVGVMKHSSHVEIWKEGNHGELLRIDRRLAE
jgi:hypothetical protein